MHIAVIYALLAALFFGASTPFAKLLLGEQSPFLLAGLLYLGSGMGLVIVRVVRDRGWQPTLLSPAEWPWLLAAIVFGGVLAPVALMYGLQQMTAGTASLLLNLEAVFTATLAWWVFKEHTDKRIILGMILIVLGGLILVWPADNQLQLSVDLGPLSVVLACFCWAVDNNLTRKVSASDALFIAGSKGLIAGTVNTSLAWYLGAQLPTGLTLLASLSLGFLGYGVSLVFFVLALRSLGAGRTGAYFSTAPFLGAVIAILVLHESVSAPFCWAALLMGVGVVLHLAERHQHIHTHIEMEHVHRHTHDEHHQHTHDFVWDKAKNEAHSHTHKHVELIHQHIHFPDIHHRHTHMHTVDQEPPNSDQT